MARACGTQCRSDAAVGAMNFKDMKAFETDACGIVGRELFRQLPEDYEIAIIRVYGPRGIEWVTDCGIG